MVDEDQLYNAEIATKHLLTLLKPKTPVVIIYSEPDFAPYWISFISHVHETVSHSNLTEPHMVLKVVNRLFSVPPVACAPSTVDFYVYVENPKSMVDIFFGINTACSIVRDGYYPFIIPAISRETAKKLVKAGFNPPILEHVLFYSPYIAATSTTGVVAVHDHVRYALAVAVKNYIESEDLTYMLFGYLVAKVVKSRHDTLKQAVDSVLGAIESVLGEHGFTVKKALVKSIYKDIAVDAIVVYVN